MNKLTKRTIGILSTAVIVGAVFFYFWRGIVARSSVIAFTFELENLSPGTVDATSGVVNQQYPMPAGQSEVTLTYTLKNKINTIPGYITATVGANSLLSSGTYPNKVNVLPANKNFTSEFHGWALPPGKHTLTLTYLAPRAINPVGSLAPLSDSIIAQATFDYIVPKGITDLDSDLIDDAVEYQLLQTFRPYYRFSLQDQLHIPKSALFPGTSDVNRPIDVLSFIKYSQMLTTDDESAAPVITNNLMADQPSRVVFEAGAIGPSDITKAVRQTDYYIDPIPVPRNSTFENPARSGESWDAVMQLKNIGLYGHVVPITLFRDPQTGILKYDKDSITSGPLDSNNVYYKIEYWQFYGYNKCYCGIDQVNHEGDWTTVQLLYDPRKNSIETVLFYEHGTNYFRYDMNQTRSVVQISYSKLTGNFRQHRGTRYDLLSLDKSLEVMKINIAQYVVEFFQDPQTNEWTHPVVYIEVGAHEPWPTPDFRYAIQPNHDGDDYAHCFLTSSVPNLGEVEHPMSWPGAKEIVNFSGNWGANFGGARGPCTHTEWTWPGSSSIRWLIPELTN